MKSDPPADAVATPLGVAQREPSHDLEVFYDADCPLCRREIDWLRRLDRRQRVKFTDLTQIDDEASDLGKSYQELMEEIHARLPDGRWITGMEVFRRLYACVGLGWLFAPTRWPVLSSLSDWGYRLFARNRLRLTGRCQSGCKISRQLPRQGGPRHSEAEGQ